VARKSFTVNDLIEMFRHWNAGRSQVEIHQALGIDRKTIRKYLQPAVRDGIEPTPGEVGTVTLIEKYSGTASLGRTATEHLRAVHFRRRRSR